MSSTLTIRAVDPEVKDRLRRQAAAKGHSMEEEVRQILRDALLPPLAAPKLGSRMHARFARLGGVDLELPDRSDTMREVDLE